MVFGEIIEPSSRALFEDEFVDCAEDEGTQLRWSNNLDVPKVIDKLIIGETNSIKDLLRKCLLESICPISEILSAGVLLYKICDLYIFTYNTDPKVIVGKVTEMLIPWLEAAKEVNVITSAPLTSLQNCAAIETSPCIVRRLSSKTPSDSTYLNLEVPNLVSGLSAGILTYCIHKQRTCTLYIGFLEQVPLDSLNTQPLLELLKHLDVSSLKPYYLKDKPLSNNLYM